MFINAKSISCQKVSVNRECVKSSMMDIRGMVGVDKIRRGNILWIDLGEHPGTHLQSGRRPCVVVSTDKANRSAKIYTVIPGTTKHEKDGFPVHCKLLPEEVRGYLNKSTIFLAEQLCTVGEKQIICKMGYI